MRREYSMTQQNVEAYVRDLTDFLQNVHHTTQGIRSYSRPHTQLKVNALKQHTGCERIHPTNTVLQRRRSSREETEGENNRGTRLGTSYQREGLLSDGSSHCVKASEKQKKSRSTSSMECDRPGSSKYGRSASSVHDEISRMNILSRFETIFDIYIHKQHERTCRPHTVDSFLDDKEEATLYTDLPCRQHRRNHPATTSWPARILKRRLTWSASFKLKRDNMEADTMPEGVTKSDGDTRSKMIISSDVKTWSGVVTGLDMVTRSEVHLRSNVDILNQQQESHIDILYTTDTQQKTRRRQTPTLAMFRRTSCHVAAGEQHQGRPTQRLNSAPLKYQLQERSARVSRHQAAGFLAQVRSRQAETQAILRTSRQLQEIVKHLAPEEETDNDDN